jgi:hypothetical protein
LIVQESAGFADDVSQPGVSRIRIATLVPDLEIKHLRFGGQIDQMRPPVEDHVGEKIFLVNLTSIGARNSDTDGNLAFDQKGQIIIGAITGLRADGQIPTLVGPHHAIVNQE